jgi:EAL domain-containing protein (putative c-di-GMP-specific phosphodiesterase class I)/ActR/RegA family two-component response regulator
MRLIVLDDDVAMAKFMATVARDRGWEVQIATEGSAFQTLFLGAPPDAIMLDLQLGPSDGIEQLQFLHHHGYAGAIVLISGFDARVLTSAQKVGDSLGLLIAAVVEKPARASHIRDVLTLIERCLASAADAGTGTDPDEICGRTSPDAGAISPTDIADAIEAGQMALYLQPIVSAVGRVVAQAEGLVRWRHPTFGMVPPELFIPVAEQDERVIDRLTMWVVETGASQYRQLAQLNSTIRISINVSGRNLHALDFPDRMARLLQQMNVPTNAIGLEITETVAMQDLDATAAVLTRLRLQGFSIAIDDFGTGHSSLTALRRMPFSSIKVDRSFVADLQTSSDSLMIVRSVSQLARDMGLASIAEGVATAETARLLVDMGIDALQGYHFSPALPFDGFVTWLEAETSSHVTR